MAAAANPESWPRSRRSGTYPAAQMETPSRRPCSATDQVLGTATQAATADQRPPGRQLLVGSADPLGVPPLPGALPEAHPGAQLDAGSDAHFLSADQARGPGKQQRGEEHSETAPLPATVGTSTSTRASAPSTGPAGVVFAMDPREVEALDAIAPRPCGATAGYCYGVCTASSR
jgi:hypothetical protein